MENIIALTADLTIDALETFRSAITGAEVSNSGVLTLDMSGVGRIDATGVALLLSAHRFLKEKGVRLGIVNVPLGIMTVLTAVGAGQYIQFIDGQPDPA